MSNQSLSDIFAALSVAMLLILTAWGNAEVMLIVAALGLVVGLLLFRKNTIRRGALAATVGFAVAIGIALVMILR